MKLRKEIYNLLDESARVKAGYYTDEIIKLFEKTIDKVEKDYKSVLTPWGKKQPMTDMYPKEMDALKKVRKMLK